MERDVTLKERSGAKRPEGVVSASIKRCDLIGEIAMDGDMWMLACSSSYATGEGDGR